MIDLADFERGKKYKGSYKHDLAQLQERLDHIQVAHIIHGRAAVVMLEGWDAAGKGGIIQRLTAEWDQRNYEVYPIAAPSAEEKAHDFLWRFETRLPAPGNIVVFDRSWYGRVLVERVEGYAKEEDWQRGYDEINAFEAGLAARGITLVKLFIHTTQEEQDKRLKARLADPGNAGRPARTITATGRSGRRIWRRCTTCSRGRTSHRGISSTVTTRRQRGSPR